MSYKLQIKRKGKPWSTIRTEDKPVNVVVQYLAYQHGKPGYPLYRVVGGDLPHLWTEASGHMRSDRYLDTLVNQIMDIVAKSKQQ